MVKDYSSAFKDGTRFKPILQNKDGKQFTVSQLVKNKMFGGQGASGEPKGADWEDIITHHYNDIIGKPRHDLLYLKFLMVLCFFDKVRG